MIQNNENDQAIVFKGLVACLAADASNALSAQGARDSKTAIDRLMTDARTCRKILCGMKRKAKLEFAKEEVRSFSASLGRLLKGPTMKKIRQFEIEARDVYGKTRLSNDVPAAPSLVQPTEGTNNITPETRFFGIQIYVATCVDRWIEATEKKNEKAMEAAAVELKMVVPQAKGHLERLCQKVRGEFRSEIAAFSESLDGLIGETCPDPGALN